MSRTRHNTKGPGYDYWGRRAMSGNCGHGKWVKVMTHRIERRRAKRPLQKIDAHYDETLA